MDRDSRYQKTETSLRDALLQLLKTKPIDQITTTELCNAADVSRNTFYAHYSAPILLLESIEDEFIAVVLEIVNSTVQIADYKTLLRLVCEAMIQQKELTALLLSENGSRNYLSRLISTMHTRVIDLWEQSSRLNRQDLELLYDYSTFGVERCIRRWTETGFELSPEELSQKLTDITEFIYQNYMQRTKI